MTTLHCSSRGGDVYSNLCIRKLPSLPVAVGVEISASILVLGIRLHSSVTVGVEVSPSIEVSTSICILLADKIFVVLSEVGGTLGNKPLNEVFTGLGTEVI